MWKLELKKVNDASVPVQSISLGVIFEGCLYDSGIDCYLRVAGGIVSLTSYVYIPFSQPLFSHVSNYKELNILNVAKVNTNE
ncbi:MAG TPA: hypothetical protein VJN02_03200 [Gammaproteobacteria bacterium]|nr:hypothetical protein [Gammaproteobacteria bacterium]